MARFSLTEEWAAPCFLQDKAVPAEQLSHCSRLSSNYSAIFACYNAAPVDFVKEFLTTFAAYSEGLSAYSGGL